MQETLHPGMHLSVLCHRDSAFDPSPSERRAVEELAICQFQDSISVESSISSVRFKHMKLLIVDFFFFNLQKQQFHMV